MTREIGRRIRARREALGMTQAELARRLDLSFQAVSKWERGENAPDLPVLSGLAAHLRVSTDWLLARQLERFARECYLFRGLDAHQIQAVLSLFEPGSYAGGALIFVPTEEPAPGLFLIEEGEVEYMRDGRLLGRLGPGELFSDYSFFDRGPCITTARALGDSFLHLLSIERFDRHSRDYPREVMQIFLNELVKIARQFRETGEP